MDGARTAVLIPVSTVLVTGVVVTGAGIVAGVLAGIAALTAVAAPLVLVGAVLVQPVRTARWALDCAVSVVEAGVDATCTVAKGGWWVATHPLVSATVTCVALKEAGLTLFWKLPISLCYVPYQALTSPTLMSMAPFKGLEPWSCCEALGSFAEPCASATTHDLGDSSAFL